LEVTRFAVSFVLFGKFRTSFVQVSHFPYARRTFPAHSPVFLGRGASRHILDEHGPTTLRTTRNRGGLLTARPSDRISTLPSVKPSGRPTDQTSTRPSVRPAVRPSGRTSHRPSARPSVKPAVRPTDRPSVQPTVRLAVRPSDRPYVRPTGYPTEHPPARPSSRPTDRASARPSFGPAARHTDRPRDRPPSRPANRPSIRSTARQIDRPMVGPPARRPYVITTVLPSSRPDGNSSDHPVRRRRPSDRPSGPTGRPCDRPFGLRFSQETRRDPYWTNTGPVVFQSADVIYIASSTATTQPDGRHSRSSAPTPPGTQCWPPSYGGPPVRLHKYCQSTLNRRGAGA